MNHRVIPIDLDPETGEPPTQDEKAPAGYPAITFDAEAGDRWMDAMLDQQGLRIQIESVEGVLTDAILIGIGRWEHDGTPFFAVRNFDQDGRLVTSGEPIRWDTENVTSIHFY